MLQIIKAVFKDSQDSTCLSLLYANQTEDDILCREELEKVEKENPDRFKLWYTLDRPPKGSFGNIFFNSSFLFFSKFDLISKYGKLTEFV